MSKSIRVSYSRKMDILPAGRYMYDLADYRPASEKFIKYSEILDGDAPLGIQLVPEAGGHIDCFLIAGKETILPDDDLTWIFKDVAEVAPEAPAPEDFYAEGRSIYTFVPDKKPSDKSALQISEYYISDLFNEMAEKDIMFLIVTGKKESSTELLLSVREEITAKQRMLLSLIFPCGSFKPADYAPDGYKPGRELILSVLTSSFRQLAYRVKSEEYKAAVNAADALDDFDLIEDDDLESDTSSDTSEDNGECAAASPSPDSIIEDMDFCVRTYNCLKRAGINTVAELHGMTEDEIAGIRNIGKKGIEEVREKLKLIYGDSEEQPKDGNSCLDQLDELIGLEDVKEQVRRIAAFARMKKAFGKEQGDKLSMSLNMEFIGNPGTAKTTVARILAGIFHELGLTESNKVLEAGRADLVAEYTGQTAVKVKKLFKEARGKVLFIDEAYSLTDDRKNSFGDEAINTIVQEMENHRDDTIVIFAGYPDKMRAFFECNPGLRSRVPFCIEFKDYGTDTMVSIAELEASRRGFTVTPEAKEKMVSLCKEALKFTDSGNGRFCRNLIENAILNFASRNYGPDLKESDEVLPILTAEDITMPLGMKETSPVRKFGFV
ncbi:DNA-directed RNA polymerase subunit alpha C-terminal domain-containing protein [Butyrivibrio sp. AE2032]|uniref:DNA-directed RNA polymerase subunit alpha C-terminal domain-containing protein n=1 Tax=Butyrivibrio sp. AE2032 TaxID=1458463 RepID=UPI00068BC1D9|nr:DNA-directed RNA polymerase subunit alpha C-terminal domain-containing protein [Butyrivibrio sp. AE2032]